jgi:hypothetical protein
MKCDMDEFICNIANSIKEYTTKAIFIFALIQLLFFTPIFGTFYYFYNETNLKYEKNIQNLNDSVKVLDRKIEHNKNKKFDISKAKKISVRNKIDGVHITYRIIERDVVKYYTEVYPSYK